MTERPNVTDPVIARLLKRAGIQRISGDVYDEIRKLIDHKVNIIVTFLNKIMTYEDKKTVSVLHIETMVELKGMHLGAGINPTGPTKSLKACGDLTGKQSSKIQKEKESKKETKKRKAKPGIAAKRDIKKLQIKSDCLLIPSANFRRLVIEAMNKVDENVKYRYSSDALDLFCLIVESYIVRIAIVANKISENNGRIGVQASDIKLALDIKHTLNI